MTQSPTAALAFATIERPQVVQRLILSVRRHFPELPIYVADQSRRVDAMLSFYDAQNVTLVRMPYDVGVTASRNRLTEAVKEDYLILSDDDFIFGPQTSFEHAIKILEAERDIAVVGGRLFDFDESVETMRNWELFLQYDPAQKILFSIPIYDLAPRVREVGGVRYYLCDAVMNFAVFRRSIFSSQVRWDEQFKSNGEHEDFFLNLKLATPFKVAYLPTMVAYHHHPEAYQVYRAHLRERNHGWKLLFDKWGLEQHIEYGLGTRTAENVDVVTPEPVARTRFFINPDLSLHREHNEPGAMLIGNFTQISSVGALNARGDRAVGERPSGRLLLDREGGRVIAEPVERRDQLDPLAEPRGDAELFETYGLEPSRGGQAVSFADEHLYFRYDPISLNDTEFFLWYFCVAPPAREAKAARRLSLVARWSDSNGTILVWKTPRMFLDLRATSYWRPIFLPVPVFPRGCNWVRFDLVTDGGNTPDPICTGFLFRTLLAKGVKMPDVLALGRLPNDGANPGGEGSELEELRRNFRTLPIPVPEPAPAVDLSLLPISNLAGLEAIYFVSWEGLGRSILSARLPAAHLPMPEAIALPKAGWSAPAARIYGLSGEAGFVSLSW